MEDKKFKTDVTKFLDKFISTNRGKKADSEYTKNINFEISITNSSIISSFVNAEDEVISPSMIQLITIAFTKVKKLDTANYVLEYLEKACEKNNIVLNVIDDTVADHTVTDHTSQLMNLLIERDYKFEVFDGGLRRILSAVEFKQLPPLDQTKNLESIFKLGNVKIILDETYKNQTKEEALNEFKEDFKKKLDSFRKKIKNDESIVYKYDDYGKLKIRFDINFGFTDTIDFVDTNSQVITNTNPKYFKAMKISRFYCTFQPAQTFEYILNQLETLNVSIYSPMTITALEGVINSVFIKKNYDFLINTDQGQKIYSSEEFKKLSEKEEKSVKFKHAFKLIDITITKEYNEIEDDEEVIEEDYGDDDKYNEIQGDEKELSSNNKNCYASEIKAIRKYSGHSYKDFNKTFTITGIPKQSDYELYSNLWNALDRNRLELDELVVYRGIDTFRDRWFTNSDNKSISDIKNEVADLKCFPSYLSTSLELRTARSYARGAKGTETGYILKIHLKKGARAFDISPFSQYASEKEFLLAPGQLKIIKNEIDDEKGAKLFECEYSNITEACYKSLPINQIKRYINDVKTHRCRYKHLGNCSDDLLFCTDSYQYLCKHHHDILCEGQYRDFNKYIISEDGEKLYYEEKETKIKSHNTYDMKSLIENIGELKYKLKQPKKYNPNASILSLPQVVDFNTLELSDYKLSGGTGKTYIYEDPKNKNKYIVKLAVSRDSSNIPQPFRVVAQEIFSQVSAVVRPNNYVPVVEIVGGVNGVPATIQPWLEDTSGLSTEPSKLSDVSKKDIAEEHLLDWLLSQHDTHSGNILIYPDGHIVTIDKEQGFKYFMGDAKKNKKALPRDTELSVDYHPNSVYGESEPYYNKFWRDFRDNKMDFDPTVMKEVLIRIENIPDSEYKQLITKYTNVKYTDNKQDMVEKFLNKAMTRKKNIRNEFEKFITNLYKIRTSKNGNFTFENGWNEVGQNISTFGMISRKSSVRRKTSRKSNVRKNSSSRKYTRKSSVRKSIRKNPIKSSVRNSIRKNPIKSSVRNSIRKNPIKSSVRNSIRKNTRKSSVRKSVKKGRKSSVRKK